MDDVEPYIEEAQNINVKPKIGDALLIDLKKFVESATGLPDYNILLNGGIWTASGQCGKDAEYEMLGLKTALAYYTFVRMTWQSGFNLSRSGMVEKLDQYSANVEDKRRKTAANENLSIADAYMAECLLYLKNNRDKFPKFPSNTRQRNNIRFRVIGE